MAYLDDVRFILCTTCSARPRPTTSVLAGAAAELCRDVLAPLNAPGDAEGCTLRETAP